MSYLFFLKKQVQPPAIDGQFASEPQSMCLLNLGDLPIVREASCFTPCIAFPALSNYIRVFLPAPVQFPTSMPIHVVLPRSHRSGPSIPTSTMLTLHQQRHIDDGLVFVRQSCMIDASYVPASRAE
ncbi:hypothetical protein PaG_03989 [Moesziomyces aphidis]|uniref:Uncharacterized protein n=1 Tax=Moesziomyces aphidis TaxID=84754 RepID=W3VK50_MOEAP|nr:hypothetical protein PaG_03989 [Moesziomyces aphidis]